MRNVGVGPLCDPATVAQAIEAGVGARIDVALGNKSAQAPGIVVRAPLAANARVRAITDGRFSGGTHGFVVGHITPEAFDGGLLALVQDDDVIEIDTVNNSLNLKVSEDAIAQRRKKWQQPKLKATKGVLFKYAKHVKDASEGCVTDEQ